MGNSIPGGGRGRDWGKAICKMEEDHIKRADEEERIAWREFVRKFRNGDFDVEVRSGGKSYRFADWDKIDQFISRGRP